MWTVYKWRLRPRLILIVVILSTTWDWFAVTPVSAEPYIRFASYTPDNPECYLPAESPGSVYIVASFARDGIQGAAFSVQDFPMDDYHVIAIPNPDAHFVFGNPFEGGVSMAFPTCQTDQTVVLYTVLLIRKTENPAPFVAGIASDQVHPGHPSFQCPLVLKCDSPTWTKECVFGGVTAPGPLTPVPSDPTPVDGSVDISIHPDLSAKYEGNSFCCGITSAYPLNRMYFGIDPDPPLVEESYPGTPPTAAKPFRPGLLQPDTRYYWRVAYSPWNYCGYESSPVWSFTTEKEVSVEQRSWEMVKQLYRE